MRTSPLALLVAPLPALAVSVELHPGDDVAGLTGSLQPGDEFVFHDGTYDLPGPVDWTGMGTDAEPITFRAAPGATPILRLLDGGHVVRVRDAAFIAITGLVFEGDDAHYDANGFSGLVIANSADISVVGCTVRRVGGSGMALQGDNERVEVRDTHIHDIRTGTGLYAGCGDASCWTRDSTFEHNLVHGVLGERRGGIELARGGQGNVIVDNVVFDVQWTGIAVSSTEFGEANAVHGNVVWDGVDSGIRVEGAAIVQNNIVFRIDGVGIRATDRYPDALQDVVISHNTVADTSDWGVRVDGWSGHTGMVFANNAVSNPTGRAFHVDDGELDDGNHVASNVLTGLVEGLDAALGQVIPGAGHGDFVDAEGWDFYPSSTSTLLGAGDPSPAAWVPVVDFSGFPRSGTSPDVGAYEYVGDGNPGWVVQEGFKEPATLPDAGEDVGGCCQDDGSEAGVFLWPLVAWFWRRRRS